jgi:hypothetical protein
MRRVSYFELRADYGWSLVLTWYYKLRHLARNVQYETYDDAASVGIKYNSFKVDHHIISASTMGGGSPKEPNACRAGRGRRCHSLTNLRATFLCLKNRTYLEGKRNVGFVLPARNSAPPSI